jgi:His/Glu/Gln/Arg/opine family amino acid ABC transporter permease subunit
MGGRDVAVPVEGWLAAQTAARSGSWARRATTNLLWWVVALAMLSVVGAVVLALIRISSPTVVPYTFDWRVVSERGFLLLWGLQWTIGISVISMALSLVFGLGVALLRLSTIPPLRNIATLYINVSRAIPLFVFIIWVYYGLSIVIGVNFAPLVAGVACLTLQYAGWLAEIFRSGIQAVDKGQWEASYSLGMSPTQSFGSIILPQAFRITIPPIANMFVGMLKDSSLVSIIGVFELIRQTQLAVSQTFRPFELYTAATAIYLLLTLGAARVVSMLEHRYRY